MDATGIRSSSPGAEVTGNCESPNMDAGSWTHGLCKTPHQLLTASAGEHNSQQGNEKAIVNIYENKNRTRQNLCCKNSLVSIVESSHSICPQNLGRHPKYTSHSIGDQMVKRECYLITEIFAPGGLVCCQQFELVDRVSERLISLQAAPPSMTRSGNPASLAGKWDGKNSSQLSQPLWLNFIQVNVIFQSHFAFSPKQVLTHAQ